MSPCACLLKPSLFRVLDRAGDLADIFKMLSDEDKLALAKQLLGTCDAEEKNLLMAAALESFKAGELDVGAAAAGLSGSQKAELLQLLLQKVEHAPVREEQEAVCLRGRRFPLAEEAVCLRGRGFPLAGVLGDF